MENVQQSFGRYANAEMVARLKGIAVDPCNPQFVKANIQPLCNQILRLRKLTVLEDSEIPWRKRKLEQFLRDKLLSPSDLILPNQHNATKLSRGQQLSNASSTSCLVNSDDVVLCNDERGIFDRHTSSSLSTIDNDFPMKQVSIGSLFLDDIVHCDYPEILNVSGGVDTDESVNSPTLSESHEEHLHPSFQSTRIPNFVGENLRRKVVPFGPRFQAGVHRWSDLVNRSSLLIAYRNDTNNSKWLGTRVWPIEIGSLKTTGGRVGTGRPNSCSCATPGSVDCNKWHVFEKKVLLKCEIGPAFFSWKFDAMGEQVSKLWTPKEQKSFDSLLRKRPLPNGRNLVKLVLKCFPHKSWKDFVSYYFNVYIPLRMSVQTRLSSMKCIDTDDEDESEEFNYMGYHKRSE